MDPLVPSDVEMVAESGDELMMDDDETEALYGDDDELIIEEGDPAAAAIATEVEMDASAPPPTADDNILIEADEYGAGGADVEVVAVEAEAEQGEGDVAFEDVDETRPTTTVENEADDEEVTIIRNLPSVQDEHKHDRPTTSTSPPPPSLPLSHSSTTAASKDNALLPLPSSAAAPHTPEDFVIVEAPSDSEPNGALAREAGGGGKGDELDEEEPDYSEEPIAASHLDEASEAFLPDSEPTTVTPANYFSVTADDISEPSSRKPARPSEPLHPSHYTNGHHDEDDSFSSYSDASSSHFPSDFFLSTILTFPANSSLASPSPYSLFQPFQDQDASTLNLPVLLSSNPDLFRAPLTEFFDALREEGAFSVEDKALNMEDEGGTLEWVLEHENEGVALVIGEDNKHAAEFSLQDFAKLHSHCGLRAPMRLRLRTGATRFLLRVNKIQEIRREMDEEVGSEHAEGREEGWVRDHDMDHHDHLDEEERLNAQADYDENDEAVEQMVDEDLHDTDFETDDHDHLEASIAVDPADVPGPLETSEETLLHAESEQTKLEDYPNGSDDPTATHATTLDNIASDPVADKVDTTVAEAVPEPVQSIIEDATLVVTATEDYEIPSETALPLTDQGDFDASAAGGLYDDDVEDGDQVAGIQDVLETEVVPVPDQEGLETLAEVVKEAAEATTSSEAVESVPIPPQFTVKEPEPTAATAAEAAPASETGAASSTTPASSASDFSATNVNAPSSTRRSTRLNLALVASSSSAPVSATTLEVPVSDDLYAEGADDFYGDSPLPTQPVDEDQLEAVEPLGLQDEEEGDETPAVAVEGEEEGDSDHTLTESLEDLVEVVISVDGDVEDEEDEEGATGGTSPKRRFDELEKDDEVVETVEVRDLKRHKAA